MRVAVNFAAQVLVAITLYFLFNFFTSGRCNPLCSLAEKAGTRTSSPDIVGCLPCSHEYITASYFNNHNNLLNSNFHDFVNQTIGLNDLCKGLVNNINNLGLSDVARFLIGEGSHRNLVSSMRFDKQLDALKWLDDHFCEIIIIERLPIGVFADPFELQHLVERKVFSAAAVFGDTNLELPSALSNRSIVEVHMDIGRHITLKSSESVVQVPLHARYPPLNVHGYAQVIIGKPDLFLRCRPKDLQTESCSWAVSYLNSGTNDVMWQIPCGDEALARIVSSVTFVSALICSILIVLSAICFSKNDKIKGS